MKQPSYIPKGYVIDSDCTLPNMFQYKHDTKVLHLDKICIIEIQTADVTIAFSGMENYRESCLDLIKAIDNKYKEDPVFHFSKLYAFHYKCIVVACSKYVSNGDFIDFCKKMHTDFTIIKSNIQTTTTVNRFVTVLNQDAPVEVGMKYLFSHADQMDTFLVCSENSTPNYATEDLRILNLLYYAISNRLVVPYYQAIHNNTTKKIEKYESLMRILDLDGRVYSPYTFLELSKKYKLYGYISRLMIEQVFYDFTNRDEHFSINLTLHDIDSNYFRSWFFKDLKKFPRPQDLTIEFLESEDLNKADIFFDFVKEVRKLGCKIAIDDFGAGYSTLSTILHLEPDFIKIDGSIISDVSHNEKSTMLLGVIQYLTKELGGQAIAEFVETADIQKILEHHNVAYSQGYHFAKPVPFESLPSTS